MTTAAEMVQIYIDAEQKVLKGVEVRMGDRWLKRSDLDMIRAGRKEWEVRAAAEASGRRGGFKAVSFSGC